MPPGNHRTPNGDTRKHSSSPLEEAIKHTLEEKIAPALAADGGWYEYVSFTDGVVYLRLRGACAHCAQATLTLKAGIERFLMQEFPEVVRVEQVF